jgi:hypothetical protein
MYFPAHFAPIKNEWLELLSSGIIILLSLFFLYASAENRKAKALAKGVWGDFACAPIHRDAFFRKVELAKEFSTASGMYARA